MTVTGKDRIKGGLKEKGGEEMKRKREGSNEGKSAAE